MVVKGISNLTSLKIFLSALLRQAQHRFLLRKFMPYILFISFVFFFERKGLLEISLT